MSVVNNQKTLENNMGNESPVGNDNYYDLILFVSELSPKNDFSFQYVDGFVSFENLSYDCVKFFLNRFKNFDIYPANLYAMKDNVYKFHFHVSKIYVNKFSTKIKEELPINKCSNRTLEILSCVQFVIDIFRGLDCVIIARDDSIELSELDQHSLQRFVHKMREIQLKPRRINFSSEFFFFHLVFDVDELVKFIEKDTRLLERYDSKIIKKLGAVADASHCESAISTDEFPTSIESINDDRLLARPSAAASAANTVAIAVVERRRESNKHRPSKKKKRSKTDVKTTPRKTRHTIAALAAAAKERKATKSAPRSNSDGCAKRSERLRKKLAALADSADAIVVGHHRMTPLRVLLDKALPPAAQPTDIDAIADDCHSKSRKSDIADPDTPVVKREATSDQTVVVVHSEFADEPIDYYINKVDRMSNIDHSANCGSSVDDHKLVMDTGNSGHTGNVSNIDSGVDQIDSNGNIVAPEALKPDESTRLIFSSCPNASGLIYASKGVGALNLRKRKSNTKLKKNDDI